MTTHSSRPTSDPPGISASSHDTLAVFFQSIMQARVPEPCISFVGRCRTCGEQLDAMVDNAPFYLRLEPVHV